MKMYESKKDKVTVKCYKYQKKFCVCVSYTDGTVLVSQYPTADKANELYKRAKELHKDLVRTK